MPSLSDDDLMQLATPAEPAARRTGLSDDDLLGSSTPTQEPRATAGSMTRAFTSRGNELLAKGLGAPVDTLAAMATPSGGMPKLPDDFGERHPAAAAIDSAIRSAFEHPLGGSQDWKRWLGAAGIDTTPQERNTAERVAGAAGAGTMAAITTPIGGLKSLGDYAANALMGLTAGAGGQEAAEHVSEPWKPLANVVGQLGAGGGFAAAYQTGKSLLHSLTDRASSIISPLTSSGQEQLAGQKLTSAASDPEQVLAKIASGEHVETVPSSEPTTYQATGDQGIGNLERAAATTQPERFIGRRADQNAARVAGIENLAPEGAQAASVGDHFGQQLRAIDEAGNATISAARQHADGALQAIGGDGALGGEEAQATALQQHGQTLRGVLAGANDAARERESTLWRAIDPDNTLTVGTAPLRRAATDIAEASPENARPMEGEEAQLFKLAQQQPAVQSFDEIKALRSRLTDAMREELWSNGKGQAYSRLSRLLDAVHGTLESGVDQQVSQDKQAVASGAMPSAQTLEARWQAALESEAARYQSDRNAGAVASGQRGTDGGRSPPSAGPYARGVSQAVPGSPGAEIPPGGRSGNAPGGAGVSPAPAQPTFDAAAQQRYAAARQATRERVGTFGEGPVGKALAPGQRAGDFKLPDSQVAGRFFNSGKTAAEDVQRFQQAVGGQPQASAALRDYAAFDLRRAAQRPDGSLNLTAYRRWMASHGEALSAFPELRQQFESAAAAQATVEARTAERAAAMRDFETSATSHFLGTDPVKAVQSALASPDPRQTFADLARMTGGNPAARNGLRRAIVDHMRDRLIGNTEAGASGTGLIKADQFQTFMRRNRAALAQVFDQKQMASLDAIAQDLKRANRSITGTKLPGGSNTAQDVAAGKRYGLGKVSTLTRIVTGIVGGIAGHYVGHGMEGSLAGIVGGNVATAMRQAGMTKVDDLVSEAMLNQELARTLMMKVDRAMPPSVSNRIVAQLRVLPVFGLARSLPMPEQGQKPSPRVRAAKGVPANAQGGPGEGAPGALP
jgi:hypothetical protein